MNVPLHQAKEDHSEPTSPISSSKASPTSSAKASPTSSTKEFFEIKKKKKQIVIKARYKYSNYRDFIFSTLGAVIGYGNIWRFPEMAAKNGGGSFLLAYFICVVLIGLPMVALEMFFGQLSGLGVGKTLGLMSPLFQGVGWAMICVSLIESVEYNLKISYCIFYFLVSFRVTENLPWSLCEESWWNTKDCRPYKCMYATYNNTTDYLLDPVCAQYQNVTLLNSPISSADEFYYNFVLYAPKNPDLIREQYAVSWRLVMSLFFAWLMVFGCLAFGIKISSKVSYVTVMFPYLGLFFVFVACLSQHGAMDGLKDFLVPDAKFFAFKTWADAVTFTIWSLSIGTGMITTLTSYNSFHNNCLRDAVIVVCVDTFTSVFAGFTAFAGLGVIAKSLDTTTEEIYKGRNLGYVVYPEILSGMSPAPFWALLFFFMGIILGLDSQIWMLETVVNEIGEIFKQCREGKYRILVVFIMCVVSFLIGIGFCTKGTGVIFHTILGNVDSGWCVILCALLEVLVVVYVYGYSRFATDISLIQGTKPNYFWKIIITVTAPIALLCLLIFNLAVYDPMTVRGEPLSETSHTILGILSSLLISIILIFAGFRVAKCIFDKKPINTLVLPSKRWSPRRKSDLELQKKEIEAAQQGVMGEFELPLDDAKKSMVGS